MPSILNKLKKRLQQEAKDAAQFTTKKSLGSFDLVKDIASRPNYNSKTLQNALLLSNPISGPVGAVKTAYDLAPNKLQSKIKKYGGTGLDYGLNYGSDLGTSLASNFGQLEENDSKTGVQRKFSKESIGRQALRTATLGTGAIGKSRKEVDAEEKLLYDKYGINKPTGWGGVFRPKQGAKEWDESNLPTGVKVAGDVLFDPTMYIPAGTVGKLSTKAGLAGTKFGKAALGAEKLGATSRSARIAGGLFEGAGKYTPAIAAGAGLASEGASRTPWEYDDMAAGFLGGALGGTVSSKLGANALRKGIISDKSGDVFRDLSKHIENEPTLPRMAPGSQWRSVLNAKGVTKKELEWNGLDEEFFNRGKISREDIISRIKENDFDIEEKILGPSGYNKYAEGMGEDSGFTPSMYENYTVPGGDKGSYREILLKQKASQKDGVDPMDWQNHPHLPDGNYQLMAQALRQDVDVLVSKDGNYEISYDGRTDQYILYKKGANSPSFQALEQFDDVNSAIDAAAKITKGKTDNNQWNFNPGQGDDVLAHIRVDDRDGGRTLFVHEIQSDWAQENRSGQKMHVKHENTPSRPRNIQWEEGEAGTGTLIGKIEGDDGSVTTRPIKLIKINVGSGSYYKAEGFAYGPGVWDNLADAKEAAQNALTPVTENWEHPFQKNWQELALKRILRYAADNGYDQIKLASGEETLKIPGMQLKGDAAKGRKTSYNEILPNKLNDIAKKFGLKVEKSGDSQSKTIQVLGDASHTPEELTRTLDDVVAKHEGAGNGLPTGHDITIYENRDFLDEVIADMYSEDKSFKEILEYHHSIGNASEVEDIANAFGLKLDYAPQGVNTIVKLTAESRGLIRSKPQTMFSVVGDEQVDENAVKRLERQQRLAEMSGGSPNNAEEPYFPTTGSERDVINQSMDEGRVPVGTEVEGRTRQALERSGMPYKDSSAATGGPVRTPYKITDVLRERYSKQSLADRDPIQNIPTAEMPTLRTHLQELIWGMDDASEQEAKAIRNAGGKKAVGEEARLKFKTNQFERPQAPPTGDYRLRAEELLQDLTDEDLNMPVANLEVADLIASIVGGRDMEDILVNRALEASAYRRSVTNQQATIPRDQVPPSGARSGMNATSNTIKFQQAVEPEAQFAAIEQIHNQITPGPPSPPTPGMPTISFLSDDEQAASLKYLADVKSLAKEVEGVKTWTKDNVIIKAITPLMNLVDPSVLMNSAVGRLIVAKTRQELAVNELSSLPLAVLDKFNGRVGINAAIGKRGTVFQTLDNGLLKGFNKHWNDVFADVENLKGRMTPQQYEYAKTFNDIIDDIRTLREMHLLNNLPREIGGKLWVPRTVKGIDNIEIIKPTNHRAKRLWEEATEGAANGVNYADPRETLKLYLKDTYNDIIKQNFADEMQKITTPTTSLVNPKIRARVEASKSGMEVAKDDLKTAAKQWKADKTNPDTTRIYMEAKERAKEARIEQLKSNFAMEQALDSIKSQETNKSYRVLEDGTKEPIDTFDVTKLGERVVTREDAKLLRGHVGTRGISLGSKEINESPLSKVLGSAGRVLRTTTSTLDTATPFIHTLPILTTRPNIWRKAMSGNYRALISPRYRDTYVAKNLNAINEMANHNIPVGSNEYFEAIGGEGDITRLLNKTLGESTARKVARGTGRQTVGRFEAAMSTNLLIARTELWKANYEKYAAKNNLDGLAQYVRNMTGALDSRALMVGKGQRDQESFWLAFSPKLVRSTFALGAMALRPDTQEGFQAAKSLSAFVGATMTLAYLANLAFNPDLDPLSAEALDPIDPTAGKKFLSAKTPIGYIGVGGQIRAAMQLLGKSGDALWRREPGVFLNNDQFDNPIMSWYVGRGAPGIQFGQDILEATTGANTNPYEDISSPSDFFKTEAQNFLPFFAQNMLEAEDMKSGALSAGIGSFGPRFAPFSESERRDMRIQEMGFMRSDGQPATTLDDLNRDQKNQYYEKWPVSKIDGEADNVTKMFNLIDDEELSFNSDVALASLNVNRGKMSKVQFREFYTKRNAEKFAKIEQIRDTFNVMPADRSGFSGSVTEYINSKNTRPEDKAVSDYYAASSSIPLKDDGTVDFDGINAAKEKVLNSLDPAQRQYVEKMITRASQKPVDELVTEYDIVKDITRPYFESDDRIFEYFRQSSGFFAQFQTYEAYQKFVADTAAQSGLTPDTIQGLLSSKVKDVKLFDQLRLEYKRLQRLQDPNLDRALTEWYGMEPANRYDYMLSGMGSDAGAALSPAIAANKSLNNGNNAAKFALANASNYKPVKRKYYRPQRSL